MTRFDDSSSSVHPFFFLHKKPHNYSLVRPVVVVVTAPTTGKLLASRTRNGSELAQVLYRVYKHQVVSPAPRCLLMSARD